MKEPAATMFPPYLTEENRFAMTAMCATELAAWRKAVAFHRALPTINKKLANRKHLERSYDVLAKAWKMANEMAPAAMAA
jgi:hypothetical protein